MSKEVEAYFRALMGKDFTKKELKDNSKIIETLEVDLANARLDQEKFNFNKLKVQVEQQRQGAKVDLEKIVPNFFKKVNEGDQQSQMVFEQRKKYLQDKYGLNGFQIISFCEGKLSIEKLLDEIDFSKIKEMNFKFQYELKSKKSYKQVQGFVE